MLSLVNAFSEFRWVLAGLSAFRQESSKQRQGHLRKLLRENPLWCRGHVLLGQFIVRELIVSEDKPNPRSVASVKLCGEAVLQLCRNKQHVLAVVEARTLLAFAAFFEKNFEQALQEYSELLEFRQGNRLKEPEYFQLVEFAVAAALALGEDSRAEALLQRIPVSRASQSVRAAKETLTYRKQMTEASEPS